MEDKKINEAIENAASNVAMEGTTNDKEGLTIKDLTIIREALRRAGNSDSFFLTIVQMAKQLNDNGEINHGTKQR